MWKEDGKGTEDNRSPFSMASHNSPGLEGKGGRRVWRFEEGGGLRSSTENNDVSVNWNSKSIIMSSSSPLTPCTENIKMLLLFNNPLVLLTCMCAQ